MVTGLELAPPRSSSSSSAAVWLERAVVAGADVRELERLRFLERAQRVDVRELERRAAS
jgi:hypothetical protein